MDGNPIDQLLALLQNAQTPETEAIMRDMLGHAPVHTPPARKTTGLPFALGAPRQPPPMAPPAPMPAGDPFAAAAANGPPVMNAGLDQARMNIAGPQTAAESNPLDYMRTAQLPTPQAAPQSQPAASPARPGPTPAPGQPAPAAPGAPNLSPGIGETIGKLIGGPLGELFRTADAGRMRQLTYQTVLEATGSQVNAELAAKDPRIFAAMLPQLQAKKGVFHNNMLIDPTSGRMIADYRDTSTKGPQVVRTTDADGNPVTLQWDPRQGIWQDVREVLAQQQQRSGAPGAPNPSAPAPAGPQGLQPGAVNRPNVAVAPTIPGATTPEAPLGTPPVGSAPAPGRIVPTDRQPLQMPPGVRLAAEFNKAYAKQSGEDLAKAVTVLPQAEKNAEKILKNLRDLFADPGLNSVIGSIDGRTPNWTERAAGAQSRIDEIQGQAFLQAYQMLRGAGAITDVEGGKAADSLNRLRTQTMGEPAYRKALSEFYEEVIDLMNGARVKAGQSPLPREAFGPALGQKTPPKVNGPGEADPLADARSAIGQGADRNLVIQRLREKGIDPRGL